MGVSKNDISFFNPPANVLCDNSGMFEKASRCLGTTSVTPKIASDDLRKKRKKEFECELNRSRNNHLYICCAGPPNTNSRLKKDFHQ